MAKSRAVLQLVPKPASTSRVSGEWRWWLRRACRWLRGRRSSRYMPPPGGWSGG